MQSPNATTCPSDRDAIIERHMHRAEWVAAKWAIPGLEPEDVAQEARIIMVRMVDQYIANRGVALSTWIEHGIARGLSNVKEAATAKRRKGHTRDLALEDILWAASETKWPDVDLDAAISHIPMRHQRIVRMYYWDGYTDTEIAEIMGLKTCTVYDSRRRALAMMRDDPVLEGHSRGATDKTVKQASTRGPRR